MRLTKRLKNDRLRMVKDIIEINEDEDKLREELANYAMFLGISLRALRDNYVRMLILAKKVNLEQKERTVRALGLRRV